MEEKLRMVASVIIFVGAFLFCWNCKTAHSLHINWRINGWTEWIFPLGHWIYHFSKCHLRRKIFLTHKKFNKLLNWETWEKYIYLLYIIANKLFTTILAGNFPCNSNLESIFWYIRVKVLISEFKETHWKIAYL
jgi:hypothetical protein